MCALLPTLLLSAPARAGPDDSPPLLCADRHMPEPHEPVPVPSGPVLAGNYRCQAEGITITLKLTADGRFEQRIATARAQDREALDGANLTGRWRVQDGELHLYQQPTRPPRLQLVESRRDPSVWMRVELRLANGQPAEGLLVGDGEEANPVAAPENGVVLVPRSYNFDAGLKQVIRSGDEVRLARFTVTRGGVNSFRFVYTPSDVEPFDIRAGVLDARASAVAVPLGMGGALLRRVGRP